MNLRDRPAPGEERAAAVLVAGIHSLRQPADAATVSLFEREVTPALHERGVRLEALLVTESARNTFTRLPVREGEHVLVWFGTRLGRELPTTEWLDQLTNPLSSLAHQPPVFLELDPTPRSLLGRHRTGESVGP